MSKVKLDSIWQPDIVLPYNSRGIKRIKLKI